MDFKWGHFSKNDKRLIAIDEGENITFRHCSECPTNITGYRKTCDTTCAVKRELRLQCERREKKKDKSKFYYSLSHTTKMYTLYDYNRKPIDKFGYKGDMVFYWHTLGYTDHGKLTRINFGTRGKRK